ncbi:cytochrome b-245 light chain-like isoform X2 [Gigantopelta aegis]|nr:cytochrome b-245 light chain-like isoform X2 [Gigantopelta aegis]
MFDRWQFGVYGIVAALFVFIIEFPRGKRQSGKTIERRFQKIFTHIVKLGGIVTRNYFVRFVLYLILTVPCCFILPTLIGGVCFLITGIIYFVAAIKGEEWIPAGLDEPSHEGPTVMHPPRHPPPRRASPSTSRQNRV